MKEGKSIRGVVIYCDALDRSGTMAQSYVQTAAAPALETLSAPLLWRLAGFLRHQSREIGLPDAVRASICRRRRRPSAVPVLTYLAGLTCNEETFSIKAGAQRLAAELGHRAGRAGHQPARHRLPRARPRAGISASAPASMSMRPRQPWAEHWRMYSYVDAGAARGDRQQLPGDPRAAWRSSVIPWAGMARWWRRLRNPGRYRSVSAFAPIARRPQCPWGNKAFIGYLGADKASLARL